MTLRQRFSNRAKDAMFLPPANRYWRSRLYGKVICLLYHRVDLAESNAFLTWGGSPVISRSDFEAELRFLKGQGAVFLTFADLLSGSFPTGSDFGVIISFDDCFLDNYTNGLEVLEAVGIKAVFFQTTGMLQADELIWEHLLYWLNRDAKTAGVFATLAHRVLDAIPGIKELSGIELVIRLRENVALEQVQKVLASARQDLCSQTEVAELARLAYATPEHVRTAQRLGHEIGSHGHRHFKRANIDAEVFDWELRASAEALTKVLGREPQAFSYPFNSYADGDDTICSRYFAQAATVDADYINRDTDPLWIPRFSWPGTEKNSLRQRRWLLTGRI